MKTIRPNTLPERPRLRRPRYTLDELIARCDPKAARKKQDREWLRGKRKGGELI